jgi:hypothetical protein
MDKDAVVLDIGKARLQKMKAVTEPEDRHAKPGPTDGAERRLPTLGQRPTNEL